MDAPPPPVPVPTSAPPIPPPEPRRQRFGPIALLLRAWEEMSANDLFTRAAAVAWYAMLAMVPFLAVVIGLSVQLLPRLEETAKPVAGALVHEVAPHVVEELRAILRRVFSPDAAAVVEAQIARMQAQPPVGIISFGLALTLYSASSLFMEVIAALNRIHGLKETRSIIRLRLLAMMMTFFEAILLISALVAVVIGPELIEHLLAGDIGLQLAALLPWPLIVGVLLFSFALTFYVAPNGKQRWRWLSVGSLLGTIGIVGASLGFRWVLHDFVNYDKTYGSLGGVVVLLTWFWIVAVLLLLAGVIDKVLEKGSQATS